MGTPKIEILLATYNGEKYLSEQIDSIVQQSFTDWQLIIRDDCSTDNTVAIIQKYQEQYPEKIVLLQAEQPSGCAQNNFFQLIQYWRSHGQTDYVMFSDQDDVWLQNKIELTFDKMLEIEMQNNKIPILIHTDLNVVDKDLNILNPSLLSMGYMDYRRNQFNEVLVQNIAAGCTMMVNKKLLSYIKVIPKKAVMHDMWMALIASAFGKIAFVNKSLILYRQHEANVVGANEKKNIIYYINKLKNLKEISLRFEKHYIQAKEFLDIYQDDLDKHQKEQLLVYSKFNEFNPIERLRFLKKYHLFRKGFFQSIAQIIL